MKIRYPKKRLIVNAINATIWSTLGIGAFIFNTNSFLSFGFLFFGLGYLGIYLFENNKQYLTIENGVITKNTIIPKSLDLNAIVHIKKFAGDYILKTEQDELTINISFIEKDSLLELEKVLESLSLNSEGTVESA